MSENLLETDQRENDRVVLAALDAVTEASQASAEAAEQVSGRAQEIRYLRSHGRSWHAIAASGSTPSLVAILTQTLTMLARATTCLRRSLLQALVGEGLAHNALGDLFGLSRQRVGAILKQNGERHRPPSGSTSA